MTDTTSEYRVHPSHWPLVLSDWKRCDAKVIVTLRGGVQLGPGRVTNPGKRDWPGELRDGGGGGRPERKWTFDLTEVVAIEAVATR